MNGYDNSIYLAGSFFSFRDKIKSALPSVKFTDPSFNRQHAMYATNVDDLEASGHCPTTVACFPEGKTPGVMTFVELGMAYDSNAEIIIANENDGNGSSEIDLLLNLTDDYFKKIDPDLINFLSKYEVPQKKKLDFKENLGAIKNIFFMGTKTSEYLKMIDEVAVNRPDLNLIVSDNIFIDYHAFIDRIDEVVVNFPRNNIMDRGACWMMGAAVNRKIPIIEVTDRRVPYPPLTGGLQRRLFHDYEVVEDYLTVVEDLAIGPESKIMYGFFEKYDGGY